MDQTTLKIAIAGFIHDIGKFSEKDVMGIKQEYLDNNVGVYLPSYKGHYSHYHAVYTAAFIEYMKDFLPAEFNKPKWGEGDSFINLCAGHHAPQTPYQWIITIADWISSGWDRKMSDKQNAEQISWKEYKITRLLPLFERLVYERDDSQIAISNYRYCYPLMKVSPTSIFPLPKSEAVTQSTYQATKEYEYLFDEFVEALKQLSHKRENLCLWFEHFDSLMMRYTSCIPAARAGNIVPDVSLYDHSKITSALAVALYLYHRENNSFNIEDIRDYKAKKFLFISGDFYGIQDFIFKGFGDTRRYRSKILRGRSFAVSLFCELAADMLCRRIGLPHISVLLDMAGKFVILAPNTESTKKAFELTTKRINDWLIKTTYGENSIGFSSLEVTPDDLVSGNFSGVWEQLSNLMEEKKYNKIDLNHYGGVVKGYLDAFVNELEHPLCPLCGKRPSSIRAENTEYVKDIHSACNLCRDHIFIGTNLVKKKRLAIVTADVEPRDKENRLFEPIFGEYQICFLDGKLNKWAEEGKLLRYWDITAYLDERDSDITVKFINAYVPKYTEEDQKDERILEGKKREKKKLELIDQIKPGDPKTLEHIACKAINKVEERFQGIEALGVLKADVDNLGLLMACGLKDERFTLSRIATLSRQLHFYFSLYLPYILKKEKRFNDIYTVFAGGDDLFLIGPWNRMIELALLLRKDFSRYVCNNEHIHFSAGITINKSHTPVDVLSNGVEEELARSKDKGRNRITVFNETVSWDDLSELIKIENKLEDWLNKDWINNSMLYRLNRFLEMAGQEKRLVKNHEIHVDDMHCVKWRALLFYSIERNIAKSLKKEQREGIVREITSAMSSWLMEYGSALKIPLWSILYNRRRI